MKANSGRIGLPCQRSGSPSAAGLPARISRYVRRSLPLCLAAGLLVLLSTETAHAMHISEGILPLGWAGIWLVIAVPFVALGLRDLKRFTASNPHAMALTGLIGAAVFIISCMPVPIPVVGSCSHPCGTGLAAILLGPSITVVITSVALLMQALFLAHGGLTTIGADICSMGIAGAFTGIAIFRGARALNMPYVAAAFLAGLLADWATYATTSFQLASALHGTGSALSMFAALILSFMPTQVPLGLLEGVITAGACSFITSRRPELVSMLRTPWTLEGEK